jgi:hypothetical protein
VPSLIRQGKPGQMWGFLDRFPIKDRTKPELGPLLVRTRIFCTPWFGVMLHVHYRPDTDRDMHDHPWPFVSVALRGGYTEQWATKGPGIHSGARTILTDKSHWFRYMPLTQRHRIDWVIPGTITLIVRGRKKPDGEWGFYTPEGYVSHHNYKRCNPDGEYVR